MIPDGLRHGEPADAGLQWDLNQQLHDTIEQRLSATGIPGAAVLIACRGVIVHDGSYGWAQDHDESGPLARPRPVEPDTVFDIASITKVAATTAITMALVDQGFLCVDDPVERYLPRPGRLAGGGIRLGHLLEHRAGLPAWLPLYLWANDRDTAMDHICRLKVGPVGATRTYSDLGMILLGAIAEEAADAPLDELLHRFVTEPLGLTATGYRPSAAHRSRCAATSTGNPTEQRMIATDDPVPVDGHPEQFRRWRRHTLVGEVNDGNAAYAFGGVAGHAGLFSTASDLATLGQALLQGGRYGGTQAWQPRTVAQFTAAGDVPEQALGFWRKRLEAIEAVDTAADESYGHRGFTGCELAIDPRRDLVLVMLSNRLHTEADPPTDHEPLWRSVVRAVLRALPV